MGKGLGSRWMLAGENETPQTFPAEAASTQQGANPPCP